MNTWEERTDHIAGHFRQGAQMKDWSGEHGFPPSVAAQVVNSLPPYLIGEESQSIIPFSATNAHVRDHFAQISSRAQPLDEEKDGSQVQTVQNAPSETQEKSVLVSQLSSFTEVLTLHLSRYARKQMSQGVVPTDEMFQQESNRVLYDSEDSWNQTIADNPEWLYSFRHLHCGDNAPPP
ncbi:hypothetical protein PHISCL_06441 [Aspergillus sclerotialis]|uniref:Uncharacterized protein n=1 Tax=Aspergillus sclerotialis TaxID=2070753 RepID=A0A3A2ZDK8_9EURO|nr:hypothetical protein PHISCL_06441 [Aspergillus sclerotialis]